MNPRQRFIETLTFGKPDKIPFSPGGPRESTLRAWHQQGLPQEGPWFDHLLNTIGVKKEQTKPYVSLDVSFKMIPTFEEKVLEHKDGHYIVQDWMGAITEISDEFDYTYIRKAKDFVTRKWHRFPVQNRADLEERMRWRFDPEAAGRFPADFLQRCQAVKDRDYVLGVSINGPFWQLREWLGMENLCMLMLDDPDFAGDGQFLDASSSRRPWQPILDKVQLDVVHFSEDMAYKAHSMISPAMTRRFLHAALRALGRQDKGQRLHGDRHGLGRRDRRADPHLDRSGHQRLRPHRGGGGQRHRRLSPALRQAAWPIPAASTSAPSPRAAR